MFPRGNPKVGDMSRLKKASWMNSLDGLRNFAQVIVFPDSQAKYSFPWPRLDFAPLGKGGQSPLKMSLGVNSGKKDHL
jgi:hypothetical protein